MLSSALKSLSSNISSNYTINPVPVFTCGPWKICDANKKSTGKAISVFVFERKSLEPQGGSASSRGGAAALKRAHDEVVERLKKEASSLARLRHPSILELVEPVEETRNGGLIFATEPVMASLAGLLENKDDQEKAGGVGHRASRYVVEDADGKGRRRREVEIDELEIQKGLLQIGKGLEFLHESAGLVHANLTPAAIFVNAKSDWKISGLGFCTPPSGSESSSVTPILLSEALNYDSRLPRHVQMNLDYSSPDFVMDNNITTSADLFSLGLIIIALYNSPHRSPLETGNSVSTYKRNFSSSSSTPTLNNNYLSSNPIPRDIASGILPRLITRRPAQRFNARDFQQAQYFDNILVSTIRFLDTLPAKTLNEKSQFMRGLPRVLPQFPKSVIEKKVLPALLEEAKDPDLLSLILQNVFKIIELVSNGRRAFSEQVIPRLRAVFLSTSHSKQAAQDRDSAKEGGLVVLLENMSLVTSSCSGKEFKDDILPILFLALDSPTHSIQGASLQTLPIVLPVLDFSTIKNDVFPVVAHVFSKTSSMAIKIRGLEALKILCGGTNSESSLEESFDNSSAQRATTSSSSALDKYTIQEKVMPLLRGIKTKEPAVMMAALDVFKQVGKVADTEFLALDALPCLWQFSLGPLLNLEQFQAFMELIKTLSTRIEQEQTRKLKDLSSSGTGRLGAAGFARGANGLGNDAGGEEDFESLVTGRKAISPGGDFFDGGWGNESQRTQQGSARNTSTSANAATFSWSTTSNTASAGGGSKNALSAAQVPNFRAITPDHGLSGFTTLKPSNTTSKPALSTSNSTSQPLQPQQLMFGRTTNPTNQSSGSNSSSVDWSSMNSSNPWTTSQSNFAVGQQSPTRSQNNFGSQMQNMTSSFSNFNIAPPPSGNQNNSQNVWASGGTGSGAFGTNSNQPQQKQGLDKYESLL